MSRDYCFTAWRIPIYDTDNIKYIVWGKEACPETKKIHYQGYVIFRRTARFPKAKEWIGAGQEVHLEVKKGTRDQARDYCLKDGNVTEWGEYEALTNNELFKKDIGFLKENYPAFFCRYHKGLAQLQSKGDKWRDVKVIVYWGKTGTNKTRRCMALDDIYKIDPPYTWWDGYMGESRLLIDDFQINAMPRGQLLNLLDGYRLRLETKGGHVWAAWTEVYITTNKDARFWTDEALLRRITDTISCGE